MIDIQKECLSRFENEREYNYPNKALVMNPMVSVTVTAYQHVNFIRDCLDGILMQELDFPIEIIVGEDGSTDGTREICIEYAEKFPELIRLFLRDREDSKLVNKKGKLLALFNGRWTRMSARGKYIALCEGDDYWTDPSKLQTQVKYMESNPGCSICYHDSCIIDENNAAIAESYSNGELRDYSREQLKSAPFIITNTVLFRKKKLPYYRGEEKTSNGDILLWCKCGDFGYGKLIEDIKPSAYRRHQGSWTANNNLQKRPLSVYYAYDIIYSNGGSEIMFAKTKALHLSLLISCIYHLDLRKILILHKINKIRRYVSIGEIIESVSQSILSKLRVIR